MRSRFHLLTFGWHERYVASLAPTGHRWDVVPRRSVHGFLLKPHGLAANVEAVAPSLARQRAARGRYHAAVAHAPADVRELAPYDLPCILVTHNRQIANRQIAGSPDRQIVSIPYGVDVAACATSTCERPLIAIEDTQSWAGALAPGSDDDWLERCASGLPVAFDRPGDILASARAYLSDAAGHEDASYAMLHAMACGVPVLSDSSRAGVIVDGVNGFVASDPVHVRERLLELLEDRSRACRMGAAARDTIAACFPIGPFVAQWQALIAAVAGQPSASAAASRSARSAVAVHSSANSFASFATSAP